MLKCLLIINQYLFTCVTVFFKAKQLLIVRYLTEKATPFHCSFCSQIVSADFSLASIAGKTKQACFIEPCQTLMVGVLEFCVRSVFCTCFEVTCTLLCVPSVVASAVMSDAHATLQHDQSLVLYKLLRLKR